jgi:hypothetical protein
MKTFMTGSNGMVGGVFLVLLFGAAVGFTFWRNARSSKVLTDNLLEPLNNVTSAKVDINAGGGNLTIDRLAGDEQVLASGMLQYLESQGVPKLTLNSSNGQAIFTLGNGDTGKSGFRFPWDGCSVHTEWQIHLNPRVSSDITAYSGGGDVRLDLAGMTVTHVSAETGGGNVDVVLPENTAHLNVTAKTGAGNVTVEIGSGITGSSMVNAKSGAGNVAVHVPDGIAAKIHVTSGMGKAIMDPRFSKIDGATYQSSDYDSAVNKVEITVKTGAGNVSVDTR